MIYYANPNSETARDLMSAGVLGCIDTPAQRNIIFPDDGWDVCCDNGCFRPPGAPPWNEGRWWRWLIEHSRRVRFAVCPDVYDPDGAPTHCPTLDRWHQFGPAIRRAGFTPAFVLQVGCDEYSMVPDDAEVLFIGGDDAYKLGPAAATITRRAVADGRWVHMGRVNSRRRFRYARTLGCQSADGTILKWGPDKNLGDVVAWLIDQQQKPMLWEANA